MIRVGEKVYRLFAGVTANQYLIVEEDGASLVDTGLPGCHRLILYSLRQLGFQPHDLKYIFLTHADPDHAGAVFALKERTGAQIVASVIEMRGLLTGQMTRQLYSTTIEGFVFNLMLPFFPVDGCGVDEIADEGTEYPVLGGLRVISSPGHTPGHISYHMKDEGVLFAGDSINCRGFLSPYLGDSTWDKAAARESFARQIALQPRIICGGHSFCRID